MRFGKETHKRTTRIGEILVPKANRSEIVSSFGVRKFYTDGLLDGKGYALVFGHDPGHDDAIFLAECGYSVDAVENRMIRSEEGRRGLNIIFHRMAVYVFPIDEATYSVIVANNILSFIEDKTLIAQFLQDMVAGLAPDGLLYFTLFRTGQERDIRDQRVSFFTHDEALQLTAGLALAPYDVPREEGFVRTELGGSRFYDAYRFLYVKTS